ncbi:hypothetical protein GOP47_0001798 [Adiantum capillus-veneris]|uniref:Uncharacterized protein n=1 Tax=Adiantum capillus-veneris TaxID=13818 RepID=A0A9D4V9Q1_ADICA|nr:hypothetical protein GOP47_0001798 [Adiantum capillus-veneris]
MSDLLFVKRGGNGVLQYCVPQGYEWAITDSHRRPRTSLAPKHPLGKPSPQTQEKNAQKKWSLGPWQRVKLRPAATPCQRNPLPVRKLQADAPFCSICARAVNSGPCNVKVECKTHAYTPSSLAQPKQKLELSSRQKAIIKARSAVVLPVVAFSKNGEWVPQSLGRKAHARLTPCCTGGWSKRSVSMLFGTPATTATGHLSQVEDGIDGKEMEHLSLDRPLLHSSALLLHELHAAKEQVKNAHTSLQRASALLEQYCHQQGSDKKDSYSIRGINAHSEGAEAQSRAAVRQHADGRFSVRSSSCCSARKKKT